MALILEGQAFKRKMPHKKENPRRNEPDGGFFLKIKAAVNQQLQHGLSTYGRYGLPCLLF